MSSVPNATSSGWFSNTMFAAATLAALQVGTGGLPTETYYKARGEKGYAFARYKVPAVDDEPVTERAPTENVSRIREVFKFTVTDLASLFGVSRQAIYDWQSGKPVAPENVDRLRELAHASDLFAAANIQNAASVLRRKISDGKNFYQIVKDGGNVEKAALDLIAMLHRESDQRARLDARLGIRKDQKLRSALIGSPMLNEEG